jgi:hypothetical protein
LNSITNRRHGISLSVLSPILEGRRDSVGVQLDLTPDSDQPTDGGVERTPPRIRTFSDDDEEGGQEVGIINAHVQQIYGMVNEREHSVDSGSTSEEPDDHEAELLLELRNTAVRY